MTIIAFDPGGSTGAAIHADGLYKGEPGVYLTAVITDVPSLWQIIDAHQPEHVVYENFSTAGLSSRDGQATLRLIGAIEAVCYRLGIPTSYQMPQERYPFLEAAKEMLKQTHKPIVHEIDAMAHLLLYEHRVRIGVQDAITAKRQRPI